MPTQSIKVISIRQPHADNIIFGDKWCENRSWITKYRGPLYIHATKWDSYSDKQSPGNGETGAIIGCVDLVDVVDLEMTGVSEKDVRSAAKKHGLPLTKAALAYVGDSACFILANPRPLKTPIPVKGKLNIWSLDVPQSQLTFGKPALKGKAPRMTKSDDTSIRVGSKVNVKRCNYFVVEINEEMLGVSPKRNGDAEDWYEESEVERGWC